MSPHGDKEAREYCRAMIMTASEGDRNLQDLAKMRMKTISGI